MKKPTKKQVIVCSQASLPYLVVFAISFIIGLILYKAKEIAPFGDQSILCLDLWGQYFSMYVQQAEADSFSDMLYSFNGAFGYNVWAQSAYYCNSIFFFIFKFIRVENMVSALNWICLLKIPLSAVSCFAFLKFKIKEKNPLLIAGAVSYSICAYMLAFYSQCMWTDSLIYVPLILIGLERMIQGKRPLMYTLFLSLTIISSFYIGFAVCIFLVLYFICIAVPMLDISHNEETNKFKLTGLKAFGKSILRFGIFSIIAGAISAIVILPVGKAIGNTIAFEGEAITGLEWYDNISVYLRLLLPGSELSLGYTGANIATSILVFVMTPLYLFNGGIKLSERIANALFLCFLFASLNCNYLNYMWHGFHFPNQLPGRWSFLISLMLVYMCCAGTTHIKKLHPFCAVLGVSFGVVVLYKIIDFNNDTINAVELDKKYWVFILVSGALIIAASCLAFFSEKVVKKIIEADKAAETEKNTNKNKKKNRNNNKNKLFGKVSFEIAKYRKLPLVMNMAVTICFTVVSIIQIYDSGSNFVAVSQFENGGMPVADGVGYAKNVEKNVRVGYEWRSGDDDFYRCEPNSGHTFNPSMLGDLHGMGYYSSTMQGSVFELLRYLGNRVYAENVSSVYNKTSPVQNGLFGVKYVIDYDHNYGYFTPNCNLIHESDEVNVWENPTTLPIAYSIADTMKDFEITDQIRMIQNQNDFLNAVCGRDINAFLKLEASGFDLENATLQESEDWNTNYFVRSNQDMSVKVHYTYTIPQDGCYYVEHNFRAGTIMAEWQGETKEIPVGGERGTYMGRFAEGTVIYFTAEINDIDLGCIGLNMYRFDENAWQQAFDQLNSESLDVTKCKSTSIIGNLHKESEGLVMATIPQDGGWRAYCDGKKVDTIKIANTLVAFNVPAGDHEIRLKYSVPGLASGLTITLFGLILLLLLSFPEFWKKYLPIRKETASITVEDSSENEADETEVEYQTEENTSEKLSVNENSKKKADNDKKK